MRGRKNFTDMQEKEIAIKYLKGFSGSKLAKEFKTNSSTIYRTIKNQKIEIRNRCRFSKNQEEQIILEYLNGISSNRLAEKYKTNSSLIWCLLKRHNISVRSKSEASPRNRKYSLNQMYFNERIDETRAYWLGFIIADGSIDKKYGLHIRLQASDFSHLYKFKECIQSEHPVRQYQYEDGTPFCLLSIYSKILTESMKQFEIFKNKVHRYSFPEIPEQVLRHYIRGYWDGDGSLGTYEHAGCRRHILQCSVAGSKLFLEKLREHLVLQLHVRLKPLLSNDSTFTVTWSKRQEVLRILDYLYSDAQIFLDRKYKKATSILKADSFSF